MNVIFDLDNTLVKRDTPILLPNREKVLRKLEKEGVSIYIASNQSPPAWNMIYSRSGKTELADKYYTLGNMICRFESVMNQLPVTECYAAMIVGDESESTKLRKCLKFPDKIIDLYPANIIISYRLDWRKPLPGMLNHIIWINKLDRKECLYVGDNERDEQAAKNAGIDFQYENEFFGQ